MRIHISESTKLFIEDYPYEIVERGKIDVKGKGEMKTYFVLQRFDAKGQPAKCPFMEIFQEQKNKKAVSEGINYKSVDIEDVEDLDDVFDAKDVVKEEPMENRQSKTPIQRKDSVEIKKNRIVVAEKTVVVEKPAVAPQTDLSKPIANPQPKIEKKIDEKMDHEKVLNPTEMTMNKISNQSVSFDIENNSYIAENTFDVRDVTQIVKSSDFCQNEPKVTTQNGETDKTSSVQHSDSAEKLELNLVKSPPQNHQTKRASAVEFNLASTQLIEFNGKNSSLNKASVEIKKSDNLDEITKLNADEENKSDAHVDIKKQTKKSSTCSIL
jgi:hypothetical protein